MFRPIRLSRAPAGSTLALAPPTAPFRIPGWPSATPFTTAALALFALFSSPVAARPFAPQAPPAATPDSYRAAEDTIFDVPAPGVLGNDSDADADPLSALLASPPSNGTLSLALDGSFRYVPGCNFTGTDSFTYQASDGASLSAPTTVTVEVRHLWVRSFGSLGSSEFDVVARGRSDGGFFLAGTSGTRGFLARGTPLGTLSWNKGFTIAGVATGFQAMVTAADGGAFVAGTTTSAGNTYPLVAKVDSSGVVLWYRCMSTPSGEARAVVETPGGVVVAGWTNGSGAGAKDIFVFKVSKVDGSLLWQKTIGGTSDDVANGLDPTSDGGVVVGATTRSWGPGAGTWDAGWLLKLDSAGNIAWQRSLGGSGTHFSVAALRALPDGSTVATGSIGNNYVLLWKVDAGAACSPMSACWAKRFHTLGQDLGGNAIILLSSGRLALTDQFYGFSGSSAPNLGVLTCKQDGSSHAFALYGQTGGDNGRSIEEFSPGYLLIGGTTSAGALTTDAWVLRLRDDGTSGNSCLASINGASVSQAAVGLSGGPTTSTASTATQTSFNSPAATLANLSWTPAEQCSSTATIPGPVGNSMFLGEDAGGGVAFVWQDVPGAFDYVVREDSAPIGAFATLTGSAPDGATGLSGTLGSGDGFFAVAGRNSCGEGALESTATRPLLRAVAAVGEGPPEGGDRLPFAAGGPF